MTINERVSPETLDKIIEAADEVITALAGTNEDVHKDDSSKMCQLWDDLNDRHATPAIVKAMALELQQYRAAASKPIFFVDIEGDDWIGAGRMGDWPDGVDDANAGRWPGCAFDFDDLPDGRVPLYAAPQVTSVPAVVPDEVIVLLNHLEDVLPDEAFNLIDVKTWNNVSMLSRPDIYRTAILESSTRQSPVKQIAAPAVQAEQPVVQLPVEFYSEHGIVVQLEKVMAAMAVQGVKYERRGLARQQLFGNTEQIEVTTLKPAIFIDGGISPDDADKLADVISKLNGERRESQQVIAEPVSQPYTLPPHVYRELVNSLRDTAVKYRDSQQLRAKISRTLSTAIAPAHGGNSPVIPDGWIPVSERLPEDGEHVIVFHPGDGVMQITFFFAYGKWWDAAEDDSGRDKYYFTHWMPLPAAPKQEAE